MDEPTRIELLKSYLIDDPADAFSKYALALEYIKIDDDVNAQILMQNLLDEHANYLPNYYHFGKLLERNGAAQKAIEIYKLGISVAKLQRNFHASSELENALEELV
jgi:hypothetical protein